MNLDPAGNGFDIGDLAITVTVVLAIAGAVLGIVRWAVKQVREIVREEIAQHTALIQPTSNGGKSLPDIAARTDRIERMLTQLLDKS